MTESNTTLSDHQRTAALQPLRQAVEPLAHHGRTSSMLLVADLADGHAKTDVVLALVEVHLANPDCDPKLVAGLQRLLAEDAADDADDTAEDHVPYRLD